MASQGEKSREEAETALAAMADEKCLTISIITAAVGQVVRQHAIVTIQNKRADIELPVLLLK